MVSLAFHFLPCEQLQIGREFVEFESGGKARAAYGEALLLNLAKDLTELYGRGFSYRNIRLMRQFYKSFLSEKCFPA